MKILKSINHYYSQAFLAGQIQFSHYGQPPAFEKSIMEFDMLRTIFKYIAISCLLAFIFLEVDMLFSTRSRLLLCAVAIALVVVGFRLGKLPNFEEINSLQRQLMMAKLSDREQEVAALIGENLSNKEICDRLCIEHSTLKTHINRIYQKCEVSSRKDFKTKWAEIVV